MFNIIERYINNMSVDDIRNFATSKDINLTEDELTFTYNFVKKNYRDFLKNPKVFDIRRYKNNYSEENFNKISKVWNEYYNRYSSYL